MNRLLIVILSLVPRLSPLHLAWPAVVVLALSLSCVGQNISGVVYDPDGLVVPNARVMLMQDYIKQKESRSGEAGEFAFTGLQPGMYQLQVKQERFSLFQQSVILGSESERVYPVLPLARESEALRINGRPASGSHKPEKPLSKESRLGGRVEPAKLLQPLRPAYPAGALARGVEGSVVLYATINTAGAVSDLIVLESPDPELDEEALRTARILHYQPMKLNGHPVPCQLTILLDFKLE
jgi:TonB family protein